MPGLALWLRADRGVRVNERAQLIAWKDASGAGHEFGSILNDTIKLSPDGLAGRPAVEFSGNAPLWHRGLLGIGDTSGRTFIVVARLSNADNRAPLLTQGVYNHGTHHIGIDANTYGSDPRRYGAYLHAGYGTPVESSTEPAVHVLSIDSFVPDAKVVDEVRYHVDGAEAPLAPNETRETFVATLGADTTAICGFAGNTYDCGAAIADVLIFSRAIEDDERRWIEQRLAARYTLRLRGP